MEEIYKMKKIYKLKLNLYNILVNRHLEIRQRYQKYNKSSGKTKKITSWIYLLILNFGYYISFFKFIGSQKQISYYEEKNIPFYKKSESLRAAKNHLNIEEYITQLKQYDIISFDVFDTLIFRPFSEPADLFYLLGEKLDYMDMKHIRTEAEEEARKISLKKRHHNEITLDEIWQHMENKTGIPAEKGIEDEIKLELYFCFANPFMKQVYDRLTQMNKKVIAVSDMYLEKKLIKKILDKNGYKEVSEIYVSCEYGKSKSNGELYKLILENEKNSTIIHVGDNIFSDIKMAKKNGIMTAHYPNINNLGKKYRPYDMSYIVGSAYRGLVNSHILNGIKIYTPEYEYGFVYGGLFALGYCNFIHEYVVKNNIDKILFLSRDGDSLKRIYDNVFNDNTEYFHWSRKAAVKLMARFDKYDYFRRFLYHNINTGKTILEILRSMEVTDIEKSWNERLKPDEKLTEKNVNELKIIIEKNWNIVLEAYTEQDNATKEYVRNTLKNCKKVCVVDIGWAGSGAMSLRNIVKGYGINCEIIGIIAGTNTMHNIEPDTSEAFLQSGKLVSYMYSQSHNRDILKKHDLNRGYNLYWELLLSSNQKHFIGYYPETETNEIQLKFDEQDRNMEGIMQIQQGIFDFVQIYMKHFGNIPYMLNISGRDAYSSMLAASGKKEKYLREMLKKFDINGSI